jgi:aminoglycoside 6'-N-acetyltransferase I
MSVDGRRQPLGAGPVPSIRPARADDLARIVAIERLAGREPPPRFAGIIRAAIDDPGRFVVTAGLDDEVVGWAATQHWALADGVAPAGQYLTGVTVTPSCRRRGVGRELIAARMAWIGQRADEVYFFANAGNVASLQAHRGWGFEEIARGSAFRGVSFAGGVGLLLRARLHEARSPADRLSL